MPNNRVKTTKALQSKKGKAVLSQLHPHSRRAKQLNRIALRDDKLTRDKKEKRKAGNFLTTRFVWFIEAFEQARAQQIRKLSIQTENQSNENLDQTSDHANFSIEELHGLIDRYINRNSRRIEEEKLKRNSSNYLSSRPKSSVQEKLEIQFKSELDQYSTGGFVLPDLMTTQNLKLIRQWKSEHRCDDLSFLKRIRLIRLFKNEPTKIIEEQGGVIGSDPINLDLHSNLIPSDDDIEPDLIEADD